MIICRRGTCYIKYENEGDRNVYVFHTLYTCSYLEHFVIFFIQPYLIPPGLTTKDGFQRSQITTLDISVASFFNWRLFCQPWRIWTLYYNVRGRCTLQHVINNFPWPYIEQAHRSLLPIVVCDLVSFLMNSDN